MRATGSQRRLATAGALMVLPALLLPMLALGGAAPAIAGELAPPPGAAADQGKQPDTADQGLDRTVTPADGGFPGGGGVSGGGPGGCNSVVVLHCGARSATPQVAPGPDPAGGRTALRLDAARRAAGFDHAQSDPDDGQVLGATVIAERPPTVDQRLRELIGVALNPKAGPVRFARHSEEDGSACSCFEPCWLNCCVCSEQDPPDRPGSPD